MKGSPLSAGERQRKESRHYLWVTAILLLAFLLRIYRLDYQSMWWDEMHAGMMATVPLDDMFANLFTIRNHVPLYFLLLRAWALLGLADFTLRFFSVVWGLLSIPLIYRVGSLIGGAAVGVLSAVLLAVSPFHIWYSQEARMYTLLSASILAAGWFMLRWLRGGASRHLIAYTACMVVAVYTHYLAVMILIAQYAFMSLHYRVLRAYFRKWLLCAGVVAGLLGIWVGMMMLRGGFGAAPIGWVAAARWYEPLLTLLTFAAGSTIDPGQPLGYLACGLCLGAIGLGLAKPQQTRRASDDRATPTPSRGEAAIGLRMLLCWLFVPLLLVWLISLDLPIPQKRSIYVDRYLIGSLPPFLVLMSWGIVAAQGRRRWLGRGAGAMLVLAAVPALANMYYDPSYARNDWRSAMSYVTNGWQEGDILLLRPSDTLPMAYYLGKALPYQEFPFLFGDEAKSTYISEKVAPGIAEIAPEWKRAWLVSVVENTDPHGFPRDRNTSLEQVARRDAIREWLDERYSPTEVTFVGIELTLYDLS